MAIGAHPGFNDLWGFGRRVDPRRRPDEIERMVAYQIGALQALAALAGHRVTYVKVHGSLNNMANEDADLALAIARAVKGVDRDLVHVCMPGLAMERASEKVGVAVAREFFADRTYDDNGHLTSRTHAGRGAARRRRGGRARAADPCGRRYHDRLGPAHRGRDRHGLRARRRAECGRDGAHGPGSSRPAGITVAPFGAGAARRS